MSVTSPPARYFSPEYFSKFYFPDMVGVGGGAAAAPARYFAPDYFSRYYFPSLLAEVAGGILPPPSRSPRDRDGFEGVVAALRRTGVFAEVFFGTDAERRAGGVDLTPAAVVTPEGWVEVDEVDPVELVRTVSFSVTIVARGNDPIERFDLLDRLGSAAQNAVDGEPLGGVCIPALTKLRRGVYDQGAPHPEQCVALKGEFSYLVPSLDGHRTN